MRTTRVVAAAVAALALAACGGPLTKDAENTRIVTPRAVTRNTVTPRAITPTTAGRPADGEVESDLRNALTAEKTYFTDTEMYNAAPATMKPIEPTLRWGKQLQVKVGDAVKPGDRWAICLTETAASGVQYAIGDVAGGPNAGTFYGRRGCPAQVTAITVSRLASLGAQSAG